MSLQKEFEKGLDAKMKGLKSTKFNWDADPPIFTEVIDGIEIDAQGIAYKKEADKKVPAAVAAAIAADKKDNLPKKDDAVKDDTVYTGEDSTGFGYVGAFDQHMSACRQSGGSVEHCVEGWLSKNSGVGLTEEKVKLIEQYKKSKRIDTLEYNDGDLMRLKNDFGIDLKAIYERMDGVCSNNAKLIVENAKLKDDYIAMRGVLNSVYTSWTKQAEREKTKIKKELIEKHNVKSDFLKNKELDVLKDYLKIVEIAKKGAKDDAVKLTPEEERKRDMNDKSDGIDPRFHGNRSGIINDFEGYIDTKMEGLKKSKFGWGKE